jgi:hypothetical protein
MFRTPLVKLCQLELWGLYSSFSSPHVTATENKLSDCTHSCTTGSRCCPSWQVNISILYRYIITPEGKLASGTPPKGSPKDGPERPDGASNQHLTGWMQKKWETSETRLTLTQIRPSKGGGHRRENPDTMVQDSPHDPIPTRWNKKITAMSTRQAKELSFLVAPLICLVCSISVFLGVPKVDHNMIWSLSSDL